jgi:putative FmdB family regulatory protein
MPTYEYRCPKGHEFELFQRMSDEPKAKCPTCGAKAKRILSAGAGFLFKGGGFYITDYRSDTYQKAAKAEQEKSTSSSSSSSSGGDAGSGAVAPSGGESTAGAKKKPAEKSHGSRGGKKDSGGSGSSGSGSSGSAGD